MGRTLRILVANAGPVVARRIADAGHEVVYAGNAQSPEMIAVAAVQEAVDGVALSEVPPAVVADVRAALATRGATDIVVEVFAPAVSEHEVTAWVGSFFQSGVV